MVPWGVSRLTTSPFFYLPRGERVLHEGYISLREQRLLKVGLPGLRDVAPYESIVLKQLLVLRVLNLPGRRDLGHQILGVLYWPAVEGVQHPPAPCHCLFAAQPIRYLLFQAVLPKEVHQFPLRSRLVVEVLEGVPPPTELRVLFERPVKIRVSAVLASLPLHRHQLGVSRTRLPLPCVSVLNGSLSA
jgi:hypothetical protein